MYWAGTVPAEDDCELYDGFRDKHGYGWVSVYRPGPAGVRKTWGMAAHRIAYARAFGEIPEGHDIHHKCGRPACVNPDHLEALTRSEHNAIHHPPVTHCYRGHEYTPENTYTRPNGTRECRACMHVRDIARADRKNAKRRADRAARKAAA